MPDVRIEGEVSVTFAINIQDSRVMDLERGRTVIGRPFHSASEAAEHLLLNLGLNGSDLCDLDGWADLPAGAVDVHEMGSAVVEWATVEDEGETER